MTGIALVGDEPAAVPWSMSHMMATAMMRSHDIHGAVVKESPDLESKYYQTVAYSPFDHVFYAVEQNNFGKVDAGLEFNSIADLGKMHYRRERRAMGVDPGVMALIPAGPREVVVVYYESAPVVWRDGRILRFTESGSPPGKS